MKVKFFLIVNSGGSIRTTKTRPNLHWDEITMNINLELPDGLFKKPQLSASIRIPEEAANPSEITGEVLNNIQYAIQQASGMEVRLSIIDPEALIKE